MNLHDQYSKLVGEGLCATDVWTLRSLVRASVRARGSLHCMQHPLGFYHLRLFSYGPVSVRLHYWPKKNRPPTVAITPYHDHVWALQSCILIGKIENVILSVKQEVTGQLVVANIEQRHGIDFIVPTSERVDIATTDASVFAMSDCYSIPPRVFHYSRVPTDTPTVTIVRAEVTESGGPRTLVPAGYSGEAPARLFLDSTNAAIVIDQLDALLA